MTIFISSLDLTFIRLASIDRAEIVIYRIVKIFFRIFEFFNVYSSVFRIYYQFIKFLSDMSSISTLYNESFAYFTLEILRVVLDYSLF